MTEHGTFKSYFVGFILSIALTLGAYFLVVQHSFSRHALIWTLVGFGIAQALVQLLFFLHLGSESKPRWNLLVFLFMTLVLVIVVGGTIWIMLDLNNRMMPPMVH